MDVRLRGRWAAAVFVVVVAWSGLQLWLTHRAVAALEAHDRAAHARLAALHARHLAPVMAIPDSVWVRAGVESSAAMILLVAMIAALVIGGRSRWAALLAAVPGAVVLGGFQDGASLGLGWDQPTSSVRHWLMAGTAVDTAVALALAAFVVQALPRPAASASARWTLVRAAPVVVVLTGWWVMRNQYDEPVDRIWLARAVVFVVMAALLARSSLRLAARAVVVTVGLPLCWFGVLDAVIGGGAFPVAGVVHHALVAVVTGLYVAAVPAVLARYRSAVVPGVPQATA
jgi:hypothetical protein